MQGAEFRQAFVAAEVGRHHRGFEESGDEHAPGSGMPGGREEGRKCKRRHHRQVEEDRRRGGCGEPVQGVEDAAIERHQRDQHEVGKGDAGEFDRKREALRVVIEAGRQQRDDGGREHERHREQHRLRGKQHGEHAIGKEPRRLAPALATNARIGRNEGGIECPFGKDGAEMIWKPQRDEERIGDRTGAEDRGQHDVAQESGDARNERQAADGQDAVEHCPTARRTAAMMRSWVVSSR